MKDISRERVYCDYSFFLFTMLYKVVIKPESEYDVLYHEICDEYGKYCDSEYNDEDESEYECILEYLYSITPQ